VRKSKEKEEKRSLKRNIQEERATTIEQWSTEETRGMR